MTGKPGRPRTLSVDLIVQAALDGGLSTLSMPSVARRVGVAHSALYRYVANREALLIAVVDKALSSVTWPSTAQPWDPLLRDVSATIGATCAGVDGLAVASLNSAGAIATWTTHLAPIESALVSQGFDDDCASAVLGMVLRTSLINATEPAAEADERTHNARLAIVLAGASNLVR